ncbi:MAG: hypothetical protein PVI21_02225 [Candidatus Woesebacteria bacterium]|jgi:hypothetical protein
MARPNGQEKPRAGSQITACNEKAITETCKEQAKLYKEDEIKITKANNALEEECYTCIQKHALQKGSSFNKRWFLFWCPLKPLLLTTWEVLWVIIGIFCLVAVWNGAIIDLLQIIGLTIPPDRMDTFKIPAYCVISGLIGGATYGVCAIYNHITNPAGTSFTYADDQGDEKEKGAIRKEACNIYPREQQEYLRSIRKEQRRFSDESYPYWMTRPLLGAIGGFFIFTFVSLFNLTTLESANIEDSNPYSCSGLAFLTGICFANFLKYIVDKSKRIFDPNKTNSVDAATSGSSANVDIQTNNSTTEDSGSAKVNATSS